MDVPPGAERFVPRWDTLFLPLHQTPAEALTQFATAIGWALRVWQAEKVPAAEMDRVLTEAMTRLEGLTEDEAGQWTRAATFFFQLILYRREEHALFDRVLEKVRQSKFREREEVVNVGMTIAEQVAAEAEARASERTMRTMLQRALTTRFGTLPGEVEQALAAANTDTLETWFDRALTAPTLEGVGILNREP